MGADKGVQSWSIYPPRSYMPTDVPVELLTHIYYVRAVAHLRMNLADGISKAFANVVNGIFTLCYEAYGDPWADHEIMHGVTGDVDTTKTFAGNFELFNRDDSPIRTRNPDINVIISIGGWTFSKGVLGHFLPASHDNCPWAEFSIVARSESSREKFAASVAEFVVEHGFDGVDIDWEFPVAGGHEDNHRSPDDGVNFTKLLDAVRQHLTRAQQMTQRHRPFLLSVATICDHVNIMTYDAYGSWSDVTGHHAALFPFIDDAVKDYAQGGVARSKIAIGIPFYGRSFSNVSRIEPGCPYKGIPQGTHESGVVDHDDLLANYDAAHGFQCHSDSRSCTPVYWNPTTGIWVTGECSTSVQAKARYAKTNGLAGVFCWEMSMDRTAALVRCIRDELC
nr:GH18 chitinase [Plasmodiophora brassicae]